MTIVKPGILIFKTNINSDEQLIFVKDLFTHIPEIIEWSVDREDHDKILRIISNDLHPEMIINMLNDCKLFCEELID